MQLVLPRKYLPPRLRLNLDTPPTDDGFFNFCMANPGLRMERTVEGEIVVVPPAGMESDYQSLKVGSQLDSWATRVGRGRASGSSTAFILSTGAILSPDAAWTSKRRLASVPKESLQKFPSLAPEFVVEVMSPSDRLKAAKAKMDDWMAGGVDLAWLIYGKKKTVYIYRSGQIDPEERKGIRTLAGEGPVAGFVLDLIPISAGV